MDDLWSEEIEHDDYSEEIEFYCAVCGDMVGMFLPGAFVEVECECGNKFYTDYPGY